MRACDEGANYRPACDRPHFIHARITDTSMYKRGGHHIICGGVDLEPSNGRRHRQLLRGRARHVGGLMFDCRRAGWQVFVVTDDVADPRALSIARPSNMARR